MFSELSVVCFVIVAVASFGQLDITDLLDVDNEFYPNRMREEQMDDVLVRFTRQTAPIICVPAGTCISPANATNTIDPRIVTPGQGTIPTPPTGTTCPAGQVACTQVAGGGQCGRRYVTSISTADGPSTMGAFPWQAYVTNQTGFAGSGVLVDSLHIITAAHKVYLNQGSPGNVQVYIGAFNPTMLGNAQMRSAAGIRVHPSFNPSTLINDIAVVRLSAAIPLGYQFNVGTACLPAAGTSYVGQSCIVSGWGRTAFTTNDAPTNPQKQVTVPIVSYATCRASMAQPTVLGSNVDTYLDQNGEVCAGGQANRDACTQDGGSPLVCAGATGTYSIAGLVIWGKNCGQPNVYGVYVDVPKYRTWIDSQIAAFNG